MSSIATFYALPESKLEECLESHRTQKTVSYKKTFFGRREIIKGERFLWEYLEQATEDRIELPYSGFVFIEYFLVYLPRLMPKDLDTAFNAAALDDNYYLVTHDLASRFAAFLVTYQPDESSLREFANEQEVDEVDQYVELLQETHRFVLQWFERITSGRFGVIHLTF